MPTYFRNVLLTTVALLAVAVAARAADMTRDEWTAFMTRNLPSLLCKEGQAYRDCYEVEQDACENAVMTAVQGCIDTSAEELPDAFTYELSRQWSDTLEKCVKEEYTEMYTNLKKDTPECGEK